jgi:L-asparaginase
MVRDRESGVLKPDLFYENLVRLIPELSALAEIKVEIPFVFDSAELDFSHWQKLARIVAAHVGQVEGVVITHGTDTLAYTASALSYMLHNLPLPVILTGAQRPLGELRSDARSNLVNAVELATQGIPEVAVCFDYRLLRGNRTIKSHISHFDAFTSPNYPLLAEVGIAVEVHWQNVRRPTGMFHVFDRFDNALALYRLYPGCRTEYFRPEADVRAVLLIGFGAGTVPTQSGDLLRRVEEWLGAGKLVVLLSEARAGRTDPGLYESGRKLLEMGVLATGDMTFEATITKLMFLLGQHSDRPTIIRNFRQPLAGEMSV